MVKDGMAAFRISTAATILVALAGRVNRADPHGMTGQPPNRLWPQAPESEQGSPPGRVSEG